MSETVPPADANRARKYYWTQEARDLVLTYRHVSGKEARDLITRLVAITGNPRAACWNFARRLGLQPGRLVREWPAAAEQLVQASHAVTGGQFNALVTKLVALTGRSRRDCWRYARKHGLSRNQERRLWPREAYDLVAAQPGARGAAAKSIAQRITKITGYPEEVCMRFVRWQRSSAGSGARKYHWSAEVRSFIRSSRKAHVGSHRELATKVMEMTGYPRWACNRFLAKMGVKSRRRHREWSEEERSRLLKQVGSGPLYELARKLRRTSEAVRCQLKLMDVSVAIAKEWFTKYTLAESLGIGVGRVDGWIDRGWLVVKGSYQKGIITRDAFGEFYREHRLDVVGPRLKGERLDVIYSLFFGESAVKHLRERGRKKKPTKAEILDDDDEDDVGEGGHGSDAA